jgi:fructose-bisphosphate aldolase class 1
MGVCILDSKKIIKQALQEHQGDGKTYKELTIAEASAKNLHDFINAHNEIPGNQIFMLGGYQSFEDKTAKFRTTVKIHKTPWQLHPSSHSEAPS